MEGIVRVDASVPRCKISSHLNLLKCNILGASDAYLWIEWPKQLFGVARPLELVASLEFHGFDKDMEYFPGLEMVLEHLFAKKLTLLMPDEEDDGVCNHLESLVLGHFWFEVVGFNLRRGEVGVEKASVA